MHAIQKNKTPTFFVLLSLPCTAMGFALSIQLSALSWILITQFGLEIHDVGLVWAAGPLAGILGQVIIGVISDKVWFWNGRRRPFILIGGVLAAMMLLALPSIGVISEALGLAGVLGVAITVALTLDLAINVSFNPTRAIIADVTEEGSERVKGYTWMQTISGSFGVLAYAIGAIWNNYVLIYSGVILVLLFSLLPTLLITEPRELAEEEEPAAGGMKQDSFFGILRSIRPLWGFLTYDVFAMGRRIMGIEPENWYAEIACAVVTLILAVQALSAREKTGKGGGIVAFQKVITAHSFSWIGIFTTFVFLVPYLQQALPGISEINLGRVQSTGLMVLNGVAAALPVLVLMPLANRIGLVRTQTLSIWTAVLSYLGLYLLGESALQIWVLMALLGIGWAAMITLPFAIISQQVSQARMGLFMGLFNLSVVLPQLVVSFGVALLVSRAPDKNVIFLVSGLAMLISAIAWGFVREPEEHGEQATELSSPAGH